MTNDKDKDKPVGYFGGWIDEKRRIGILTFKSYPNVEEQEYTEEDKKEMK